MAMDLNSREGLTFAFGIGFAYLLMSSFCYAIRLSFCLFIQILKKKKKQNKTKQNS